MSESLLVFELDTEQNATRKLLLIKEKGKLNNCVDCCFYILVSLLYQKLTSDR